jgi:hypothetical protein
MRIINKFDLDNKKAVTTCNGLIRCFVNLRSLPSSDLTDENKQSRMFFIYDLILNILNKSIMKYSSFVLYKKFNKLAITY